VTFISSRTRQNEAWTKDLKTGLERQLTYGGVAEWATISHVGLQVAIYGGEPGKQGTKIVPSAGGPASPLCSDCILGDWMPDGSGSLIARGRPMSLVVHDFASKRETTLAAHPKWNLLQGRVSPDGRWVAFHTTNAPTVRQIYVVPLTDKLVRPDDWIPIVTDFGVQPSWPPDGLASITSLFETAHTAHGFNGSIRSRSVLWERGSRFNTSTNRACGRPGARWRLTTSVRDTSTAP
jgi:hypothetical protein